MAQSQLAVKKLSFGEKVVKDFKKFKYVYALALLGVAYYVIFHYLPMYGIVIAFKDYRVARGILGSSWVGFRHFQDFFGSFYFFRLIRNTVLINVYGLIFGFPAPIILALLLNEIRSTPFKRSVQTITYLPHFISQVVICGIVVDFFSSRGLVNEIVFTFTGERLMFLLDPKYFRSIYVGSGIWQGVGWGSIIYLAALAGVDVQLYDAAVIDGCNRFQRMLHVTLPGILPTIIIMLILNMGSMMSVGFEKVILLYNEAIFETADVISSFVYRRGFLGASYSFGAAVSLFNSVINFALLITVNKLAKRLSETSLW